MNWKALKELLLYIQNTLDVGIRFGDCEDGRDILSTYADSDFAPSHTKRKSRTGYVIFFLGSPVAWKSKLQNLTACSISEAELYAMYDATMHSLQINNLLTECYSRLHLRNYEDNSGCADWINNLSSATSSRMKGIETKYYKLQDLAEENIVTFIKISTDKQRADMFTKQMDGPMFLRQLAMLYGNYN
jgi:hypothetical protein